MPTLQAIALGIVQGLTEFLPISSSAHLIVVPWLFRWDDPVMGRLTFDVSLHLGTLVALVLYFARDWSRLIRAGVAAMAQRQIGADHERRLACYVVIGSIPAGVAGWFAESNIEAMFHEPNSATRPGGLRAMAAFLAIGGLALWAADYFGRQRRQLEQLTLGDAIVIGLVQALSIFPGVSRSGSTIMAGLALRLNRAAAARFSFLLAAPIVLAAGIKGTYNLALELRAGTLTVADLQVFAVGFMASMLSGYVSIRFLLRFLEGHSTAVFAVYRCLAAGLITWLALSRG